MPNVTKIQKKFKKIRKKSVNSKPKIRDFSKTSQKNVGKKCQKWNNAKKRI